MARLVHTPGGKLLYLPGGRFVTDTDASCCGCGGGGGGPCGVEVGPGCPCGPCADVGNVATYTVCGPRFQGCQLAWSRPQVCCFHRPTSFSFRETAWLYPIGFDPLGPPGHLSAMEVIEADWTLAGGGSVTDGRRNFDTGFFDYTVTPWTGPPPEQPSGPPITVVGPIAWALPLDAEYVANFDGYQFLSCTSIAWDFWKVVRSRLGGGQPVYWAVRYQGQSGFDADAGFCRPDCPRGACCCAGVCYGETTFLECQLMGGRFAGEGSSCADTDCSGRGACCKPDGSCTFVRPADCLRAGGVFRGAGVRCGQANCPQPMGICCLPTGCIGTTTRPACVEQGGSWFPNAPDCSVCNLPPPIRPCCFPDGSCAMLAGSDCIAQGGTWQMNGTTCEAAGCPVLGGACCYLDINSHGQQVWTCADGPAETQSSCDSRMGTFYPGLTCDQIDCPVMPGSRPRRRTIRAATGEETMVFGSGGGCSGCGGATGERVF